MNWVPQQRSQARAAAWTVAGFGMGRRSEEAPCHLDMLVVDSSVASSF